MPARILTALALIAVLAAITGEVQAAPSCDDPPELLSLPEHQLSLAPILALLPAPTTATLCAIDGAELGDCRIDRERGGPIPPAPILDASRTIALAVAPDLPGPGATRIARAVPDAAREHPGYAPGIDRPPRP